MKKPTYRQVLRWQDVDYMAQWVALVILGHTSRDGWALVGPVDFRGMDQRTLYKVIDTLKSAGRLEEGHTDKKRKMLFRLHNTNQQSQPSKKTQ
jgi:hypothetical protein